MPKNGPKLKEQPVRCHDCGLHFTLPTLDHKQSAHCPRCSAHFTAYHNHAIQNLLAYACTALVFFVISLTFTFLSFSINGQQQSITLLGSLSVLVEKNYLILAILQGIFMLIIPLTVVLLVITMLLSEHIKWLVIPTRKTINLLFKILPWAMAEVFLVGVLVSLIKVVSMADISLGMSFYAYILFVVSLVCCLAYLDRHQLEVHFQLDVKPVEDIPKHKSIQATWAYLLTACMLYIPANVLPMMHTQLLGDTEPSTIMGGVILLWGMGSYPIAMVIFVASIVIPVAKLVILAWLNYSVMHNIDGQLKRKIKLYRMTEFIGRWSMIDVFVVAVLVSLIQSGNLVSIVPGYAVIAFCAVVIMTMIAALSFDTKLIWKTSSMQRHTVGQV
jgi:paraquat-inducible protein A